MRHFDEWDKRDFARSVAAGCGLGLAQCAAIGDSRSDLPIFAEAGLSVAFNATAQVREVASVAVDGPELPAVLPALGQWFLAG
jgi:phosphoserine phosphatase